ncbi:hypothetical protein BGZ49_006342 [Haplosporangium sp. Z 27]|nr:hypothetical protein BGZ49_006342 [Haplosporangium sp. Z 27]
MSSRMSALKSPGFGFTHDTVGTWFPEHLDSTRSSPVCDAIVETTVKKFMDLAARKRWNKPQTTRELSKYVSNKAILPACIFHLETVLDEQKTELHHGHGHQDSHDDERQESEPPRRRISRENPREDIESLRSFLAPKEQQLPPKDRESFLVKEIISRLPSPLDYEMGKKYELKQPRVTDLIDEIVTRLTTKPHASPQQPPQNPRPTTSTNQSSFTATTTAYKGPRTTYGGTPINEISPTHRKWFKTYFRCVYCDDFDHEKKSCVAMNQDLKENLISLNREYHVLFGGTNDKVPINMIGKGGMRPQVMEYWKKKGKVTEAMKVTTVNQGSEGFNLVLPKTISSQMASRPAQRWKFELSFETSLSQLEYVSRNPSNRGFAVKMNAQNLDCDEEYSVHAWLKPEFKVSSP